MKTTKCLELYKYVFLKQLIDKFDKSILKQA